MFSVYMNLTDADLRKRKYPLDVLIQNVNNLSASTLLRHQTLSAEFCRTYLLDDTLLTVEEQYLITTDFILKRQPHIALKDLLGNNK